jgi:serine protease Do
VDGKPVKSGNDLVNPIATAAIGSKVKLTYIRDRAQKETTAVVEDRTRVFPNTAGRMGDQPGETAPTEFGLHVEELTPDRGRRVGVEGQKGVLVIEVEPASFAEDLGFARGDVISDVNHETVNSVSDYRNIVSKLKAGDDVVFKVLRRQDTDRVLTLYLSGKVPADNQQ